MRLSIVEKQLGRSLTNAESAKAVYDAYQRALDELQEEKRQADREEKRAKEKEEEFR